MKCFERKSQKKSLMMSPSTLPMVGRSTATACVRRLSVLSVSWALTASACFLRSSRSPTAAPTVVRCPRGILTYHRRKPKAPSYPSMKAVLAFDQGTTSSRAIAFGRDGRILGVSQQEFRQIYPQPGWVEHDALEIWRSQRDVAARALAAAGLGAGDVGAIGITNQRETTVLWERATGRPVA